MCLLSFSSDKKEGGELTDARTRLCERCIQRANERTSERRKERANEEKNERTNEEKNEEKNERTHTKVKRLTQCRRGKGVLYCGRALCRSENSRERELEPIQ